MIPVGNEIKKQKAVDVVRIFSEYNKLRNVNEIAAEETYVGMPVTVTGPISCVCYECGKLMTAIIDMSKMPGFKGGKPMSSCTVVKCYFKASDIQNVMKLKKGTAATICGAFKGVEGAFYRNVIVSNCVVQQAEVPQSS